MMTPTRYIILFLLLSINLKAQSIKEAEVSFISGESVYLRFEDTRGVEEGDTLYDLENGKPCLAVLRVSSVSCLAKPVGNCLIEKGMRFKMRLSADEAPKQEDKGSEAEPLLSGVQVESQEDSLAIIKETGRSTRPSVKHNYLNIGLSTAITQSNNGRNNYRSALRTTLKMDSLFGQNLSLETYGILKDYRRNYESEADPFRANLYNLALIYRPGEHHKISLGRKINRRVSSLGAIDGIQWEGSWNRWSLGTIVGSRPDFETFGYNPELLQYGLYGAYDWQQKASTGQISFGILEQRNAGAIDRRYIYTQQNFSWGRFYAFASAEVDLYENFDTAAAANTAKLSSLYLSLRYRITDRWNVFASYDSRQQIIFFERYDTEVERLLAEQGARQGFRIRSDYRFFRATTLGLSYNWRSNPTFGNHSENLQSYLRQGNLPWIGGSLVYRYNSSQNGNLNSEINSLRYSRRFRQNWQISAYYRYASYKYAFWDITLDPQMYYGLEFSKTFAKEWNIGLMGEYSQIREQDLIRVYLRINRRLRF